MIAFILAGALLAVALIHAFRLAVPARADLVRGVGRWDAARARASRVQRIGAPAAGTWSERYGRWLADRLRRSRDLTRLNQDLAVTGESLEAHLSRLVTFALAGLLGPLAISSVLRVAGFRVPVPFGAVTGVALALVMVGVVVREVRETAARRRAEFRRNLSVYLDLVAMSMQAGRGHSEALPAAAAIGSGWAFTDLQDAIDGARFSGITAWEALGRLGERLGIPELTDLEGALRLANDDGAKVKATLVARADTLRARRIADAEADANQRTESMKFALIVMVLVFLTYELYPSIARLFAG
jgi:Flp pilus assembly protein TadB